MDHLIRKHLEEVKTTYLGTEFNIDVTVEKFFRDKTAPDLLPNQEMLIFEVRADIFDGTIRPFITPLFAHLLDNSEVTIHCDLSNKDYTLNYELIQAKEVNASHKHDPDLDRLIILPYDQVRRMIYLKYSYIRTVESS